MGEWDCVSGTSFADAVKFTVMMNIPPIFFRKVAVGYTRQQCRSIAMVVLFPKLWSEFERVSW